ncbi:MAG: glycoside hydrolase, partial [Chryseobacterium sp.]
SYSQCKPEAAQLFLSGVNHIFYHGTTNSPENVPWPGWLFYASVEMNPNNSLWPHAQGLNNYIARCQSILQAGTADNELLIYWPVYDVWNKAKGLDMALKVHDVDEWLHPTAFYKLSKDLAKSGYSFDFASDRLLAKTKVDNGSILTAENASPYKVLIVPSCDLMSVETLDNILQLANNGATVIFQSLPQDVPGLNNLEARRKKLKSSLSILKNINSQNGININEIGKGKVIIAADIQGALSQNSINRETLTDSGLQFIRRKVNGDIYYYLVNHTAKDIDTQIPVNAIGNAIILDPQSGLIGSAAMQGRKVRVQIKSGEALFLNVSKAQSQNIAWQYLNKPDQPFVLNNPWLLHFTAGGPELP